jgi:hypothetical protein
MGLSIYYAEPTQQTTFLRIISYDMNISSIPGIVGTVGIPDDPITNEQKVLNAGRIPYKAFEVCMTSLSCDYG